MRSVDESGVRGDQIEEFGVGREEMLDVGADGDVVVVAFLASPRSIAITGDAIAAGGGVPRPVYY